MRCTYTGLSYSIDFKSTNKLNSHCIYINKKNRFFLVFSTDQEVWICNVCGGQYASELDVKTYDSWYSCKGCHKVYQESCAWDIGIIDDSDELVCQNCFNKIYILFRLTYESDTLAGLMAWSILNSVKNADNLVFKPHMCRAKLNLFTVNCLFW